MLDSRPGRERESIRAREASLPPTVRRPPLAWLGLARDVGRARSSSERATPGQRTDGRTKG